MIRKAVTLGIVAMVGGVMMTTSGTTAKADIFDRCEYKAFDKRTRQPVADGWAMAFTEERACKRAKRRCERELKRKQRRGKVGHGAHCHRYPYK